MTVRNLATLDRTVFQPLGRLLQEAFADGLIATGNIVRNHTVTTALIASYNDGTYLFKTTITGTGGVANIMGLTARMDIQSVCSTGIASPFQVLMETTAADPNLSGMSWVSAATWGWNLSKAGACAAALTNPPANRFWHRYGIYGTGSHPTHFIYANGPGTFGGHYAAGTPTPTTGDALIPIKFGGNTFHLIALVDDPG